MGVDLHRIGTGISSGTSRNGLNSIVSFPSVPSFPAAGTILQTLTLQTYPIAEGGAYVNVNSNNYPSQTASVYRKADGSGGNYLDWASAFDIVSIVNGTTFTSLSNQSASVEVPSSSGNYYQGGTYTIEYNHDGYGGYYENNTNYSYYTAGSETNLVGLDVNQQLEVPSGSGTFFNNGQSTGYTWDGSGGYNYPVTKGNYYDSGVFITFVPDGTYSGGVNIGGTVYDSQFCGNDYFWDGSGGTSGAVPICKYYPNGTFIFNDGTVDYFWDGTGGYYT